MTLTDRPAVGETTLDSVEVVPVSSRSVRNTKRRSKPALKSVLQDTRAQCHTIRQMSQSESMDRVWMEDVFKFDSFRFRAAHHHFGLFCQQEKENSPAICIDSRFKIFIHSNHLPWYIEDHKMSTH